MAATSRNAPCPCGSGKKYKQCCLGRQSTEKSRGPVYIAVMAISVAVGVGIGLVKGPGTGVAIGGAVLVGLGIIAALTQPPPPGGTGDPGAINFGR